MNRVIQIVIVLLPVALSLGCGRGSGRTGGFPERLTDDQFWHLSASLSEPPGAFEHSENLVSNEVRYVHLARALRPRGGAYVGVGPEQNFSYIARLRPAMAFVIDIREENRNLHLMYKALFELSTDRAEFLSRLFSRPRPPGAGTSTSVQELFASYDAVRPEAALYEATVRLVRERLVGTHRFPLPGTARQWIEHALRAFYMDGPNIHYARSRTNDPPGPSYRVLMTATDIGGQGRSYLASEEAFTVVKELQARNLIVPVVGDFAGPHALRATGGYIGQHAETVFGFYASNVEVYLNRQKMVAFCANLASLPYRRGTRFIGSKRLQSLHAKLKSCP